jgi:hypothetical protein
MHQNSSANQRAYPDLMREPAARWHFTGAHCFLLLTLLLALRVGATPSTPEEELPNLGSSLSSASPPLASEQQVATLLKQSGTVLNAAEPKQQAAALAVNQATSLASQRSERWLSQLGRARVNFGSNSRFKQFYGELALLVPLDESASRPLTFSQLGIHYYDKQAVANIGLGQRHLINDWLWGYNAFLDQHLKRGHSRLGVGAELWRDYLKFSGNGYFAVSGWKESKSVEGYEEKVASGFDLRVQGYWPTHPQLGAELLFENYFGEQVALFDKQREDWQKNPLAATIGVNYTPVPLLTVGVDHKIGRKSKKETRLSLQFNYQLDLPWEYQVDPQKVAISRTLAMSRYDWVQRNNRLVLQYRQLAPISLTLPAADQLVGFPEETIVLEATVAARFGFKEINWVSEELSAAGGQIKQLGDTRYEVRLPKKLGRYPLTGIAVDQQGNQSSAATTELTVKQPITLTLPSQLVGRPEETLPLDAQVDAHFGFQGINWETKELVSAGGSIKQLEGTRYQVTLPKALGRYPLIGTAVDQKGNQSTAVTTELVVSVTTVTLELPQHVTGTAGERISLDGVVVSAPNGFRDIQWGGDADEFNKDGGKFYPATEGNNDWALGLPNQAKTYTITGIAYDKANNASTPQTMQVIVQKKVPELTIQGPAQLPDIWLKGETITLTATGGDGHYAWTTSDPKVAKITDQSNEQCKVQMLAAAPATIQVTSAGSTVPYELKADKPLLQAMDNTQRNYLEAEQYCQQKGASLPTQEIIEAILTARKTEFKAWAEQTFMPTGGQTLAIWLKAKTTIDSGRPSINLITGHYEGSTQADLPYYTICQFNP